MTEQHTHTPTDTPFWRFSLNFYRQAGVAEACIALQDECGVDVNLMLFLLWLAASGWQLSVENIKELDEAVRGWRDLTIIPIRETRRKLKGAPTLVEAGRQEAFRTKIKAIELEAERLQQEALYARSRSVLAAARLVRRPPRGPISRPMNACSARVLRKTRWIAW